MYEYKTSGTCSQRILFDVVDGKVVFRKNGKTMTAIRRSAPRPVRRDPRPRTPGGTCPRKKSKCCCRGGTRLKACKMQKKIV